MHRQISTVCNFVLEYMKCKLLEDMVDVYVRIRTLHSTHMLQEDRKYLALKFQLWRGKSKPLKALQTKLSRYIHGRETVASATAAPVSPKCNKKQEEKQCFGQPSAQSTTRYIRQKCE